MPLKQPVKASDIVSVLLPVPPVRGLGCVFDYLPPANTDGHADAPLQPGDYVEANFAGRKYVGVVWDVPPDPNVPKAKLKPLIQKLDIPPLPKIERQFIDWLSAYTMSAPGAVLRMMLGGSGALQLPMKRGSRPRATPPKMAEQIPTLNDAQKAAATKLVQAVAANAFSVTLLDGVTGAGKTETYAEAIAAALDRGQQVLVLLPEIALTGKLLERFQCRFGFFPVEWHSALTPSQRRHNWHQIAQGQAKLVVGARSALLLPYANLGLIVVDEEHEAVYKQEETVLYHARDMAVLRASLGKIPAILSTATPALETWANVQALKYGRVELPGRFAEAELPTIELVDLRVEKPPRQSWISPPLLEAMRERMQKGEQTLLYLNRRGYAPLTLCRSCGYRFQCPQCTAWMVGHDRGRRLQCHHCGFGQSLPESCPACHAVDQFAACGPGVERIEEEVAALFPQARRAVLTSDEPSTPVEIRALVDRMQQGDIDILIGTQMVTKGHHFPKLTLVGVIDADLGLAGGDLRAGERTYQLLTQVAGRAGRGEHPGTVLIQTTDPAQPLMQALAHGTGIAARDVFLASLLRERQIFKMPPIGRLAALIISSPDRAAAERYAKEIARSAPRQEDVHVLGPAPAPMALLRGRHRLRFLVKAPRDFKLQAMVENWLGRQPIPKNVQVTVDIDPYSFM